MENSSVFKFWRMCNEIKYPLLKWYEIHRRELSWRLSKEPYRIWVSEVILQQTRVEYGEDYFNRFMEQFPNVKALAEASQDEVMKCWQGLGYYRRAIHLHTAARSIVGDFNGVFPTTHAEILKLKGVGSYTAAAICSIAYNQPYAVVDGNVYRVLARLFGIDAPIDSTQGRKSFAELADLLLDKENAGEYNQAMMDFGALQCTPQSPNCGICPFKNQCVAFLNGKIDFYPVKEKKTKIRSRYFNYLQISSNGMTLLKKRSEKDIWHHLYEFPMVESDSELDFGAVLSSSEFSEFVKERNQIQLKSRKKMPKHKLSHQSIFATFYETEWNVLPEIEGAIIVPIADLDQYAISRLTESYLETLSL